MTRKTKRSEKFYMVETKVYDHRGELIAQRGSYIPAHLPPEPEDRWWRVKTLGRRRGNV